jgi:DNA primase catalytic subunit
MNLQDLKNDCSVWYKRPDVQWELLKAIRSHSTDFKGKERAARFFRIGDFHFLLIRLKNMFIESDNPYWAFFHSIAYLRMVTSKGKPAEWQEDDDFYDCIYGYDLPIDMEDPILHKKYKDNEFLTVDEVREIIAGTKEEAVKLAKYLKSENFPFKISFSGCMGFHITLEWKDFASSFDVTTFGKIRADFGDFVCRKAGLKTVEGKLFFVDTGTAWGAGRALIRTDCSLHQKTGLAVLPLTIEELENFDPSNAEIGNVKSVRNIIETKRIRGNPASLIEKFLKENDKDIRVIKKSVEKENKKVDSIIEQISNLDSDMKKKLLSQLR